VWDAAALNWNAGASAPANQYWSSSHADSATFAGAPGTVTVAAPVTTGGMTFAIGGYTLNGSSPITLAGTGSITVTSAPDTATINTPLAGSAGLRKNGNGTLVLNGASTYTGATLIQQGSLIVNGSLPAGAATVFANARLGGTGSLGGAIDASGTVAPGATLRAASARFRTGSTLATDVAAASSGRLTLTGVATIDPGAILAVQPAAGFAPAPGQTYDVLVAAQLAGSFSTYTDLLTPTANGLVLAPQYLPDRLRLTATLPGDATLDGAVDFNDLVKLAQSYNTTLTGVTPNTWEEGDFNLDGTVDFNDLVKLAQNYNQSAAPAGALRAEFAADWAAAQAVAVPESSTTTLILLAWSALGRRRVRRRTRPRPLEQ
jgi:autotransporter-associated beta strand protein